MSIPGGASPPGSPDPRSDEAVTQRARWRFGAWWFAACLLLLGLIIDLRLLLFRPGYGVHVVAKTTVAAILLVGIAGCIVLATHNERIVHGSVAPRPGEFVELTARRRRSRSAIIGLVLAAGLLGAGLAIFFMALSQHARSVETQNHGILSSGTVAHIDDQTHCSRYTCTSASNLVVVLDRPVLGHTTTTVHDPDQDDSLKGARHLPIFVDPEDPAYAELPGEPLVGTGLMLGASVLLGVVVLMLAAAAIGELRTRRRRRVATATR